MRDLHPEQLGRHAGHRRRHLLGPSRKAVRCGVGTARSRSSTGRRGTMQLGLVTVMIPSYNYARFLTECVESAANQANADVAIVDNGSTDGSPEIGAALAERYDNVRFKRYEDNQGIITSFTRCREEIRGEYAVLLPADDYLAPGSLQPSAECMAAPPGVGLVYGPAKYFGTLDEIGPDDLAGEVRPPNVFPGEQWIESLCRTGLNPIRTPEAVARASV